MLIVVIVIGCSKSADEEKSVKDRTSVVREVKVATLDGLLRLKKDMRQNILSMMIKRNYSTLY